MPISSQRATRSRSSSMAAAASLALIAVAVLVPAFAAGSLIRATSEFLDDTLGVSYQGRLVESGVLVNRSVDLALRLFELPWEAFTRLPSRQSAEPLNQAERAQFLARVARDGYLEGYEGVRISATGRRFRILDAILWNLRDGAGERCGQAATFARWEPC